MGIRILRYKVEITGWFDPLPVLKEMLRYSGSTVHEKISDREYILEHRLDYESKEHLERRLRFFHGQIVGRWGSFGCKVSGIQEVDSDSP